MPVFSVHPPYLSEKNVLEAPTCCAETTSYSTSSQNVQSLRVNLVTFTWEGGCHIFSSTLTPVHSRDNDFHRNYSDDHPFSGGLHHTFKNGRILSVETRRTPVAPHHHWWRLQYRIIGTRMEAKKSMHIQPPAESACASNMFVSYFASKHADVGTASCFCRVCFTSDDFLLHVPSFGLSLLKFYFSCVKPLVFLFFMCIPTCTIWSHVYVMLLHETSARTVASTAATSALLHRHHRHFRHLTHLLLPDMSFTKSLALQTSFPLLPKKIHIQPCLQKRLHDAHNVRASQRQFRARKTCTTAISSALSDCKQHLPIGSSSVVASPKKKKHSSNHNATNSRLGTSLRGQ